MLKHHTCSTMSDTFFLLKYMVAGRRKLKNAKIDAKQYTIIISNFYDLLRLCISTWFCTFRFLTTHTRDLDMVAQSKKIVLGNIVKLYYDIIVTLLLLDRVNIVLTLTIIFIKLLLQVSYADKQYVQAMLLDNQCLWSKA